MLASPASRALRWLLFTAFLVLFTQQGQAAAPVSGYQVVARYPHATDSYTEGFFYLDGLFYEGTGMKGRSAVMSLLPMTGKPVQTHPLPPEYFGEGIVAWGPYLYEWTWQSHIGFVYDRTTFRQVRTFHYDGEGWGMTQDGKQIITSDGSSVLRFRDPETFRVTRQVTVRDGGRPVALLNELEWVKGEIYANVWHTNRIARIAPQSGMVLGWIDLAGILPANETPSDPEGVLNGIAYDAEHDRLFVSGKEWPWIYEIKVVPRRR